MFDIWWPLWAPPGEDGAEAEPAFALFATPLLLTVIALLLGALTLSEQLLSKRFGRVTWHRIVLGVPRVFLVAIAVLFFVASAGLFVGVTREYTKYWQIPVGYTLMAITIAAFLVQQWQRLTASSSSGRPIAAT